MKDRVTLNKLILILVVVVLQSSCSSNFERSLNLQPTILLFDQHLTESEVSSLSTRLINDGFIVRRVEVDVPPAITQTTIIHSLLVESLKIDLVEEALRELGYSNIRVASGSSENHIYRYYNLGLYIPEQ